MLKRSGFISSIVCLCCALWALPAFGTTNVLVISGSGELRQLNTSTQVEQAVPLTFQWWTDEANTTGGQWYVYRSGNAAPIATGPLTGSPTQVKPLFFTLPANTFLAASGTSTPVTYTLTVAAAHKNGLGKQSTPVTITEALFGKGDTSGIKPPPPESFGYPVADFVAYRPLQESNIGGLVAGLGEGIITLQFWNPPGVASDAVTVSLSDSWSDVQQAQPDVLVPALTKGQTFRVAIALKPLPRPGESIAGWIARFPQSQSMALVVGMKKLNSSFVRRQAGPVLGGMANECLLACPPTSPPWVANFRPTALRSIDEGIAAGNDFLYTGDYNNYEVYKKQARTSIDLTGTALSASSAAAKAAAEGGGAATLFEDFWFPSPFGTPLPAKNMNVTIPKKPINCNPYTPWATPLDKYSFPTTTCINDFYDARLTYDDERGRFWIISHARSWDFPAEAPGKTLPSPNKSHPNLCVGLTVQVCNARLAEGSRRALVGVSKAEDPHLGFNTSLVDSAGVDWPVMGVQGRYLLISYNENNPSSTPYRLYDADALAQGVKTELTPAFLPADFANGIVRMPKHHNIQHDIAFIVSTNGPTLNLYAWNSPKGTPKLLGPATYIDPADSFDSSNFRYEAVVRGNYLYMVTCQSVVAGSGPPPLCSYDLPKTLPPGFNELVIVWRIPISLSTSGTVFIDAALVQKWKIQDTSGKNLNFDNPTIEVTKNNDVVVSFRAWDLSVPNQVWYDVLYSGESTFRNPAVLSAPANTAGGPFPGQRIDFVSSSIDPSDDETVWFIGADGNGPIVGSVRP